MQAVTQLQPQHTEHARLAVGVDPSVAYVKGFRNENLGTKIR